MSVELIFALIGAVGVVVGGFWALAKLVVAQFEKRLDERFATQEQARIEGRRLWDARLTRIEEEHRELERNFLVHLSELPEKYQRREDHIRFETVITAKLDALYAKLEQLADRQQVRI